MTIKELLKQIYNETRMFSTLVCLVGMIIGMAADKIESFPIAFSAVLIFTLFDTIVHGIIIKGRDIHMTSKHEKTATMLYRFPQATFQAALCYILWTAASPFAMVLFLAMWWFGICDIIYYVDLKIDHRQFGSMPWTWWTAQGMFVRWVFRFKDITPRTLNIGALVGAILVIVLAYLENEVCAHFSALFSYL